MARREREGSADERRVARILAVVARIPRGRVATYGQVAAEAGLPRRARLVGWVLRRFGHGVPWQRVVGAGGRISPRGDPDAEALQRELLRGEGVSLGPAGSVDLRTHGWCPRTAHTRARDRARDRIASRVRGARR